MRPILRGFGSLCAIMAAGCTLVCASPFAPAYAAPAREQAATYTYAFQDADVAQVAEAILGQALGVPYTVDPSVTAKLTFHIERRLTREQLLKAFEQVLAAQDIVLVRQGDNILVTQRSKARGAAGIETSPSALHKAGYQTVAVPLTYASPSEVAKALQSVSGNTNIVVFEDDKTGLLVLGGTAEELQAGLAVVRQFDRGSLEGSKIRWFELKNATAGNLADDLEKVLKAGGLGKVAVVPLARLNGVFAFARTEQELDRVGEWVTKLDIAPKETESSLWIYHPKNLSAESLSQTLSTMLLGQTQGASGGLAAPHVGGAFSQTGGGYALPNPAQGGQGVSRPPESAPLSTPQQGASEPSLAQGTLGQEKIRIGVEAETNALLIECSATRWRQIEKFLDEIDETPGEVLIEASIMEVTLNDEMKFGVDWRIIGDASRAVITSSPAGITGATPQLPGIAITLLSKNIQGAVNALGTKTAVDVISAPKIVVLNNHTARLNVGDQVPIITQTAAGVTTPGAPVINSVDYENTGVIMQVKPRITGDNRIFLELSEQVSTAIETSTSDINSPTIQQREFDSSLIIPDGGTVALGGLISTTRSKSDAGVPYLMNLPWGVGQLFKSKDSKTQRDELIVLITATVIKDQPTANKVMVRLLDDMHDIEAHGLFKR